MKELSIFVDESGDQDGQSKYYALTTVFHNQADSLEERLTKHRQGLVDRGLADLPFHAGPILNGHDCYKGMDIQTRKAYFSLFFMDVQHLPITYQTFLYRRSEFATKDAFVARMKRDIINLLFDHLPYLQSFDKVKIYYDGGQEIVAKALHAAAEYVLSKDCLLYRKSDAAGYLLAQAADMLCTLELTAHKFRCKEATRTDERFFGSARAFKNNYLKAIKRKRLAA